MILHLTENLGPLVRQYGLKLDNIFQQFYSFLIIVYSNIYRLLLGKNVDKLQTNVFLIKSLQIL